MVLNTNVDIWIGAQIWSTYPIFAYIVFSKKIWMTWKMIKLYLQVKLAEENPSQWLWWLVTTQRHFCFADFCSYWIFSVCFTRIPAFSCPVSITPFILRRKYDPVDVYDVYTHIFWHYFNYFLLHRLTYDHWWFCNAQTYFLIDVVFKYFMYMN